MLLKLKAREFIDSDQEKPSTYEKKKKIDKDMLLDRYIEFIQQKNLTKQDERLLDVLGFKEAFKLLTEAKTANIEENQIID